MPLSRRTSGRALSRARRTAWWLVLLVAAGLLTPTPASAHPFGDPQRIEIADDGEGGVRVTWRVGGTDDLTLLGIELGVLPEDRVMLDGAVAYDDADGGALAAAPEFAGYLTERITVTQQGRPCAAAVTVATDVAADGAELRYTCPAPVDSVTVTSRMLTDLHEAYRTLATGPNGQKAVYDAAHESADWAVGGSEASPDAVVRPVSSNTAMTSTGKSAAVQLTAVGGGLIAVALAGAFWYRRRGREA